MNNSRLAKLDTDNDFNIKKSVLNFLFISVQLLTLLFVIIQFNIQVDTYLTNLVPIIGIGFGIHYWLPKKIKLPFFVLLTFTAIYMIVGISAGLTLIGIGLFLIALCNIPVSFRLRIFFVFTAIALLFLFRARILVIHEISVVLAFIGSMFMLRLLIYLKHLQHAKEKPGFWNSIAYFFMLPNISFPLFPTIDFDNFKTTYYNRSEIEIYSAAIRKIFRGIVHLLVYRYIYYNVIPTLNDIDGLYMILLFFISSYSLILRLSGMYHLALGILGLFGFDLPEIFNNYFFANNFNDLWRRVNKYWREFMMKIFYYPIYFRVRKFNKKHTIAISIIIVFFINWIMHAYQWIWIRGPYPLKLNDLLFWMIFGFILVLNSKYQEKYKRHKPLHKSESWDLKKSFFLILRTIGVFLTMCMLWMLWSSTSIKEWLYLLSFFGKGSITEWIVVINGFIAFILVVISLNYSFEKGILGKIIHFYNRNIERITVVFIGFLMAISFPSFNSALKIEAINSLHVSRLNSNDRESMERGYYQKLLNADHISIELWQAEFDKPRDWETKNNAIDDIENVFRYKLTPNSKVKFKGATLTTNKWGMRDKEYSLEKPENTTRIALLGGSVEMGSGVADNETYESMVEDSLNAIGGQHYEILNFSASGYHVPHNVINTREKVFPFHPDVLIYTAHSEEFYRINRKLTKIIMEEKDLEFNFLKEIKKKAGATSDMCRLEISNRLKPYMKDIVKWGYEIIVNECKKNNVKPIWFYFPALGNNRIEDHLEEITQLATNAGFIVTSAANLWENQELSELQIAKWDLHPNKKGHQIIANELLKALKQELELNKNSK